MEAHQITIIVDHHKLYLPYRCFKESTGFYSSLCVSFVLETEPCPTLSDTREPLAALPARSEHSEANRLYITQRSEAWPWWDQSMLLAEGPHA